MIDKSQEVERELAFLRDNALSAIRAHQTHKLEENLDIYRELVEAFVATLKNLGAEYDMAQTLKEQRWLDGGWSEEQWLATDIYSLIDEAFAQRDINLLQTVGSFPISLAYVAVNHYDYFTFARFLRFVPYCVICSYSLAPKERNDLLKYFRVKLASLANHYIGPLLRESRDAGEVARVKDLATGVVLTFKDLLKATYDQRDLENFTHILTSVTNLFNYTFDDIRMTSQIDVAEAAGATEADLRTIDTQLTEALLDAKRSLDEVRVQLRFGMLSWIVNEYRANKVDSRNTQRFYQEIGGFGNLAQLTDRFFDSIDVKFLDLFGWRWWLHQDADGAVIEVNLDVFHSYLYCLKALEFLGSLPGEQARKQLIPERSSLVWRTHSGNFSLIQIVDEIERERSKWEPLIQTGGYHVTALFKALLRDAVQRQREADADRLIAAGVSDECKANFKRQFVAGWKETGAVRHIIHSLGDYSGPTKAGNADPDIPFYGFNLVEPKDLYIESESAHHAERGREYGREMGRLENDLLLSTMLGSSNAMTEEHGEPLGATLRLLRKRGYQPNVILLINAWRTSEKIARAEKWRASQSGRTDKRLPFGEYDGVPVYNLQKRRRRGIGLVMDLQRFGTMQQYCATGVFPGEEPLEVFSFLLKAYDVGSAAKVIEENPDWLRDPETKLDRSREEATKVLLQRVHLRIMQRFKFVIKDGEASIQIDFARDF